MFLFLGHFLFEDIEWGYEEKGGAGLYSKSGAGHFILFEEKGGAGHLGHFLMFLFVSLNNIPPYVRLNYSIFITSKSVN